MKLTGLFSPISLRCAVVIAYLGLFAFSLKASRVDLPGPMVLASIGVLIPFLLIMQWLDSLRLRVILGRDLNLWICFRAVLLGKGLHLVTPGRLGLLSRAIYLKNAAQVPVATSLGYLTVDQLLDAAALGLIAVTALAFTQGLSGLALVCCAFVVVLGVWGAFPLIRAARKSVVALLPVHRFKEPIVAFFDELLVQLRPQVLRPGLVLAIVAWSLGAIATFFFLNSAGLHLSAAQVLMVYAAGALGKSIPLLPGGVGTGEASMVMALQWCEVPFGVALTLSVAHRLGYAFFPLIGTLWILSFEGFRAIEAKTPIAPS